MIKKIFPGRYGPEKYIRLLLSINHFVNNQQKTGSNNPQRKYPFSRPAAFHSTNKKSALYQPANS